MLHLKIQRQSQEYDAILKEDHISHTATSRGAFILLPGIYMDEKTQKINKGLAHARKVLPHDHVQIVHNTGSPTYHPNA